VGLNDRDRVRAEAADAISWLFVPGSRPDRFERARSAGADATIVDLEDAVAPAAKPAARDNVVRWLRGGASAWVRINAAGTPWHDCDLRELAGCESLLGVVVPKSESVEALEHASATLAGRPLIALVESAVGIRDIDLLAASGAATRIAFGSVDYALDIDAQSSDEVLLYARSAIVTASRAAGIAAPIDGVTVETQDAAVISADAARARSLGFGGKLCIHPAQVEPVQQAFTPTGAELTWAGAVLATWAESGEPAAFQLNGEMIDRPVIERARRLIARARES
jgi:citrate lyase subunit beta / citryl-CoA lyase